MLAVLKIFGISLICLMIDQLSKFAVTQRMMLHQSSPVIGGFFHFTYIHNPGAAFGIAVGSPLFYTIFTFIAIAFIVFLLYRSPDAPLSIRLAYTMILGGALGNLTDRLRLGEVIDFFDFGIGRLRWPVFNMADVFVTSGIILLSFCYLVQKDVKRHETKEE